MSKKSPESAVEGYDAGAEAAAGTAANRTANELAALLRNVLQSIGGTGISSTPPPAPLPITPEGEAAIAEFRAIATALHTAAKFNTAAGA